MKSHYPDFDVLDQQEEWDEHTRAVVLKRLRKPPRLAFFEQTEASALEAIYATLLDDYRSELLQFIVAWYDGKLFMTVGEGQREENIPPEGELIRAGLRALETAAVTLHGHGVAELAREVRALLLDNLAHGAVDAGMKWAVKLQQAFFRALLINATKAYYSHPTVWSEIGYAGPAYPRGYVRTEFGLTDPWEATRSGQ